METVIPFIFKWPEKNPARLIQVYSDGRKLAQKLHEGDASMVGRKETSAAIAPPDCRYLNVIPAWN